MFDVDSEQRVNELHSVLEKSFSPDQLRQLKRWGIVPEGAVPMELRPGIIEVTNLGVITGKENPDGQPLDDEIDPLVLSADSPLYSLLQWSPLKRLWGIGQLGLNRDVPIHNRRSRGRHILQVGFEGLKAAVRLGLTPPDQFLAFVAGVTHDPHPGLGDAAKMALGISETEVAKLYFTGENEIFLKNWVERVAKTCGIEIFFPDLRQFIERMIKREETSLPAELIHGSNRTQADLDFWTFTVIDAIGALQTIFFTDSRFDTIPWDSGQPFPERMSRLRQGLLQFDQVEDLGRLNPSIPVTLQEIDIRPSLVAENNQLVITDPEAFHRLVQLAAVLYEAHYYHPNNLGPELMFAREITKNRNLYPSDDEFMTLADRELVDRLCDTPAGRWLRHESYHNWRMVEGENDGRFSSDRAVEGVYPPVNLRLSTLVRDQSGRIGPWKELFPEEAKPLVTLEQRSEKPITLVHTGG